MAEEEKGASRIPQLDGLRGLAILLVLGLHFLNDSNHGHLEVCSIDLGPLFGWGGLGLTCSSYFRDSYWGNPAGGARRQQLFQCVLLAQVAPDRSHLLSLGHAIYSGGSGGRRSGIACDAYWVLGISHHSSVLFISTKLSSASIWFADLDMAGGLLVAESRRAVLPRVPAVDPGPVWQAIEKSFARDGCGRADLARIGLSLLAQRRSLDVRVDAMPRRFFGVWRSRRDVLARWNRPAMVRNEPPLVLDCAGRSGGRDPVFY